jgi:hypothetical protein
LREAAFSAQYGSSSLPQDAIDLLQQRGVKLYQQRSEGFWGQSVAEFALALTLCALRGIPQNYHEMLTSHEPWQRYHPARNQGPGTLGAQFSDDTRFTHGTIAALATSAAATPALSICWAPMWQPGIPMPPSQAFTAPALVVSIT